MNYYFFASLFFVVAINDAMMMLCNDESITISFYLIPYIKSDLYNSHSIFQASLIPFDASKCSANLCE